MQGATFILTLSCPDRKGVVSQVSTLLYQHDAFITEVAQYSDPDSAMFFSRNVFTLPNGSEALSSELEKLAESLEMKYTLRNAEIQQRVLVAVSGYDHCLNVLLTKWRAGVLGADLIGVVSNHEDCRPIVEHYGLPFHYLPVTREIKREQEAKMLELIKTEHVDLVVLARYMQILSDDFCAKMPGRVINIHHSFLPGFKGARPYHQAHARGVKIIGATAHYVTADLDEGPIIAQEVKPIDHRTTVKQMVQIGHDLEASALAQAVKLHGEERVVLNGVRTVIL